MADSKITALTSISTSTDPANDPLVIVDVSDTSMAATGTTKKVTLNQLLGAGGTATLASATITGDLTVDTSTLKVDSGTNNVSIGGLVNKVTGVSGSGTGLTIQASAGPTLGIWDTTDPSYFTNLAQVDANCYLYNNAAGALLFGVGNVEAMRLNSTGLGVGGSVTTFGYNKGLTLVDPTSAALGIISGANGFYVGLTSSGGPAINVTNNQSLSIVTGGSTSMVVTSTGQVGIGVTPSAWGSNSKALQVGNGSGAVSSTGAGTTSTRFTHGCYFDNTNWRYQFTGVGPSLYELTGANAGSTHAWYVSAGGTAGNAITFTQAMTLDASGNLLVGTTSLLGDERLIVTKATTASYLARFINSNSTVDTFGITVKYSASAPNDAGHSFLYVEDNVNVRAQIYANGGLANYSANNVNLSDARTKTDIKPLASYWNKIKALELVTFKYKDQTHDDDNIGLISQQVESVAPELVSNEGFGETPADGVPLKTIYTTDLYHAAIKALQEAMARIEALEAKLA